MHKIILSALLLLTVAGTAAAQRFDLDKGWKAKRITDTGPDGIELSFNFEPDDTWLDATVPGTILTTLLNNGLVPDPFIGLNNALIPDISEVGRDYYSYWFYNSFFTQEFQPDQQIWLEFRGVNYSCDVYLNGHKLNQQAHEGMFLRYRYNVTKYINQGANNRIAVAVYPPDPAGIPNGGQGGDGTIARGVTMQCTAGWDWTEPVADRNTGIWDKVTIEITGVVDILNPYVSSRVPDVRTPGEIQSPAFVTFSAELHNTSGKEIEGEFGVQFAEGSEKTKVKIEPGKTVTVTLKEIRIKEPRLWWPNGIGRQPLYEAKLYFLVGKDHYVDIEQLNFGLREFSSEFDEETGGRVFKVNGQNIFIKGGNWIASDALLRLSSERYDSEVKLHAAMNMNMIRVWGGSITERPEFYNACDKYGIMVWQDLWITGDCNGRWPDPKKADNQSVRRNYPDNHNLFIESVADQVKMLRNHPSLVMWCGGNEFPPPPEIDSYLKDSLFPALDPQRFYLSESTGKELMTNPYGGTGDGPYNIMEPSWFFTFKSFPFNAEIGSVGLPVIESLKKILSPGAQIVPDEDNLDAEWRFHKYSGYKDYPARYGPVTDFSDFVMKAQMVNYEQYRSLQEGQNARMWEWYTGMLVWKNQNPWTALRGQFYDVWLEPNASFYGYRNAAKPFHAQINLDDTTMCVVNSSPRERRESQVRYTMFDLKGNRLASFDTTLTVPPNSVTKLKKISIPDGAGEVVFVRLAIYNQATYMNVDENIYWLAASGGDYSAMHDIPDTELNVEVFRVNDNAIDISVTNSTRIPAIFTRFRITAVESGSVLTPAIYEDNYITLMPGEKKFIRVDISSVSDMGRDKSLALVWDGFNVADGIRVF
ncbi:MAG: glycosyl hydrolase [Bacteroidales bacterium]|nr:glycosyl hydrolase [Bacteroidales bacterium]